MGASPVRRPVVAALLAAAAVAAGPSPSTAQQPSAVVADDELKEAARERYVRGRDLLGQGNAVDALQEFAASYQLFPSWAALYGMAMCQDALDRPAEALRLYRQVLREGGDQVPVSERTSIGGRIAALEERLGAAAIERPAGRVVVTASPEDAEIAVDGEPAGRAPLRLDLATGPHRIEARREGFVSETRWIDVAADEDAAVRFELAASVAARPPEETGAVLVRSEPSGAVFIDGVRVGATPTAALPLAAGAHDLRVESDDGRTWSDSVEIPPGRTVLVELRLGAGAAGLDPAWFWTAAALAGALAVGGAATGGYVLSLEDEYYDPATSPGRRAEIKSTGDPLRIVTDVLFGTALGCAAGATTLFFFTDFSGGGRDADVSLLPGGTGDAGASGSVPVAAW